ncbi:MAG: sugar phosphate isomerase/epimerase [bacterium]
MMKPGINLEFARTENMSFEAGLEQARKAGYEYVECFVFTDVTVKINSHLSVETSSPYHHIDTAKSNVSKTRQRLEHLGLKFSALDAHTSLLIPQIGVPFLNKAIDWSAEVGCPIVMSDEGPLPTDWMTLDDAFDIMCISLDTIIKHANSKGIKIAIELHNKLTTRPDMLLKLLKRFSSSELGVNFDTGNSFLAGNNPVEMLQNVVDRVIHVHAKDIPVTQLHERGHVTGTRVGVGVGDGMVDMPGIISVLKSANYDGVISVECDTLPQASKSYTYLTRQISL